MSAELLPDQALLQWINGDWASPALDWFFSWVTDKYRFSFPLLLILLGFSFYKERWNGLLWWLGLVLTIALSDQFSNQMKDLLTQARPCAVAHDWVRLLDGQTCGDALRGMPSSHALLGFAIWTYVALSKREWWRWRLVWLISAIVIAISRIYLAKHLPSQVLMGAWLGILFGFACTALIYRSRLLPEHWRTPTSSNSPNS